MSEDSSGQSHHSYLHFNSVRLPRREDRGDLWIQIWWLHIWRRGSGGDGKGQQKKVWEVRWLKQWLFKLIRMSLSWLVNSEKEHHSQLIEKYIVATKTEYFLAWWSGVFLTWQKAVFLSILYLYLLAYLPPSFFSSLHSSSYTASFLPLHLYSLF